MQRKEEAYNYLKNAIMSNKLEPNTPISELALSQKLKMSRSPIREALRELESEGLIVSHPSKRAFVSDLTQNDVEEIYELRQLLENWALGRSINRISERELDDLENKFETAYQEQSWELFHEADRKLHGLIVERANSKRLHEFVNMLYDQIERIRRMSARTEGRNERSYQEHKQIIQAIRKRELENARRLLDEHLRSVTNSAVDVALQKI